MRARAPLGTMLALACVLLARTAAADLAPDQVERLRALGYVDVDRSADARSGVVKYDPVRSSPGYDLFTNAHVCLTQIIDARGDVLHAWSLAPCTRWDNTRLLPDGDLLVVGRYDGAPGGVDAPEGAPARRYLARLAWDGSVRWLRRIDAHHDAELTPRGDIVVLTERRRKIPALDPERPVKDHLLTLLSADGEQLDEASLYDLLQTAPPEQFHFRTSPPPRRRRRAGGAGRRARHRARGLDPIHANSVFWMADERLAARDPFYATSNVLVTLRHQDAIVLVDWDARRVVWAWGQGELSGPHDAEVLPSGHVLVFDNGLARGWSRVVEMDPSTRRIVWEYHAPVRETFFTLARGASQRLANGNTLVAESGRGHAFEVTPAGETVWEFFNPNFTADGRGAIVRMRRLDPVAIDERIAAEACPEQCCAPDPAHAGESPQRPARPGSAGDRAGPRR